MLLAPLFKILLTGNGTFPRRPARMKAQSPCGSVGSVEQANGSSRRAFLKQSTGTVLFFGVGAAIAEAIPVDGSWVAVTCRRPASVSSGPAFLYCNKQFFRSLNFAMYIGDNICAAAPSGADCNLMDNPTCAYWWSSPGGGVSPPIPYGGGVTAWCSW
jgi:hypothetical protein